MGAQHFPTNIGYKALQAGLSRNSLSHTRANVSVCLHLPGIHCLSKSQPSFPSLVFLLPRLV